MNDPSVSSHANHIARHLQQLRTAYAEERLAQVLAASALVEIRSSIVTVTGATPTGDDCRRYLTAVHDILGASTGSFARVNFALMGCDF